MLAKRGKQSGAKSVWRCPRCLDDAVAPLGPPPPPCRCGGQREDLLRPLAAAGKLLASLPTPQEIRRYVLEQKELFQRAADAYGQTLTDFIVSSAQAAAEKALRSQYVIELTARSTEAFVAALLNPPAPNERLRAAAHDYLELVDRT